MRIMLSDEDVLISLKIWNQKILRFVRFSDFLYFKSNIERLLETLFLNMSILPVVLGNKQYGVSPILHDH